MRRSTTNKKLRTMVRACHFFAGAHWRGLAGSCSQYSIDCFELTDRACVSMMVKKIQLDEGIIYLASHSSYCPPFPVRLSSR